VIPETIDPLALLADLNRAGWRDYKVEMALGFNKGYIAQIRCGMINLKRFPYVRGARLLNFHEKHCSTGNLVNKAQAVVSAD